MTELSREGGTTDCLDSVNELSAHDIRLGGWDRDPAGSAQGLPKGRPSMA
jgi:hypothetical protein